MKQELEQSRRLVEQCIQNNTDTALHHLLCDIRNQLTVAIWVADSNTQLDLFPKKK